MDGELIYNLYVIEQLSTTDIGKRLYISYSTVRRFLLKHRLLRSREEGHRLAAYKMGQHLKGKKRVFTDEWKENIRLSAIKRWDKVQSGIKINSNGYYEITRGQSKGRLLHDVIMEIHIGRKLKPDEIVHHDNKVRTDNEITNLILMTKSKHCSLHSKENYSKRKINKKGQFA